MFQFNDILLLTKKWKYVWCFLVKCKFTPTYTKYQCAMNWIIRDWETYSKGKNECKYINSGLFIESQRWADTY